MKFDNLTLRANKGHTEDYVYYEIIGTLNNNSKYTLRSVSIIIAIYSGDELIDAPEMHISKDYIFPNTSVDFRAFPATKFKDIFKKNYKSIDFSKVKLKPQAYSFRVIEPD